MNAHEQVKKPNSFAMPREIKQDRNPNQIIESAKFLILPENCIIDPFKQNDIQLSRNNPILPSYPYVHQHVLRLVMDVSRLLLHLWSRRDSHSWNIMVLWSWVCYEHKGTNHIHSAKSLLLAQSLNIIIRSVSSVRVLFTNNPN